MKLCYIFSTIFIIFLNLLEIYGQSKNYCCANPCEHTGVCESWPGKYSCDCTSTGHYGKHCEISKRHSFPAKSLYDQLKWFKGYKEFWRKVNTKPAAHKLATRRMVHAAFKPMPYPPRVLTSHSYVTVNSINNRTFWGRLLEPIPQYCPTQMGIHGPRHLPPIKVVAEKLFLRKHFKRDKLSSNLLFASYGQHYTHVMLTTHTQGKAFTNAHHNMDQSHVYGQDVAVERKLRSFKGGRLLTQVIRGEEYPPWASETGLPMVNVKNDEDVLSFGHFGFTQTPMTTFFGTIWMREHNRVATILADLHKVWDDERLFQTAKLITLGELLVITMREYNQHWTNSNFNLEYIPEYFKEHPLPETTRLSLEFNLAYHWHHMVPSFLKNRNEWVSFDEWLFRPNKLQDHGTEEVLHIMLDTPAGEIGYQNVLPTVLFVHERVLNHSRTLKLKPFNEYRKMMGLLPMKSFMELTGDRKIAEDLEYLYGHIDALEFFPGLICEKKRRDQMVPSTMEYLVFQRSIRATYGNLLTFPNMWRPSTFGGKIGFKMVKDANLRDLLCGNIPGNCPRIGFKVNE